MADPHRIAKLEEEQGGLAVKCPSCEEKYVFRSTKISQLGGAFVCKVCRARVVLPDLLMWGTGAAPSTPPATPDTGAAERSGSGPDGSRPQAPVGPIGSTAASPPQGPPAEAQILCPHCRKTFTLSDSRAERKGAGASTPASARPEASSSAASRPRAPEDDRATILVVEDTEFFLTLAADALSPHYTPILARTSAEAIGVLAQRRVDAVIIDLTLEKENDGLQVLTAAASRGIPSLIFTARNEAELWGDGWSRLQKLGARDLVIKGMNIDDQIVDKVAELLRS